MLFFFKHKTAYELRISDWSSDVCSSDLRRCAKSRSRNGVSSVRLAVRILSRQEIGIAEPVAAWALPPPQTLSGVRKRDEPNRPSVIRLKPTMAGTIFNSIILLPFLGSRLDRLFVFSLLNTPYSFFIISP